MDQVLDLTEITNELNAGYSAHRDFAKSLVWQDLSNEVQAWLDDVRSKLELEEDTTEIKKFQGIASACRYFLSLPDTIVSAYEGQINKPIFDEDDNDGRN